MVTCGECKYWDSWGNVNGKCERVEMLSPIEKQSMFAIETDGQLDEEAYLLTGKNFGCILGKHKEDERGCNPETNQESKG